MAPRGNPRSLKFTMVLTEDEKSKLEELAEADSLPAATWLRQCIVRQHADRFGAAKKKKR